MLPLATRWTSDDRLLPTQEQLVTASSAGLPILGDLPEDVMSKPTFSVFRPGTCSSGLFKDGQMIGSVALVGWSRREDPLETLVWVYKDGDPTLYASSETGGGIRLESLDPNVQYRPAYREVRQAMTQPEVVYKAAYMLGIEHGAERKEPIAVS